MAGDSRRKMMLALGIEIFIYGAFAILFLFFLLVGFADSGSDKRQGPFDPDFGLHALAVLWPLLELVLSWAWLARSAARYAESRFLALGNTIALVASILAPIVVYELRRTVFESDMILFLIMVGIPLIGHWTARLLWLTRKTDAGITPLA